MYSNIQQSFIAESRQYYQQKRLREKEQVNNSNMLKRRQPKTLFRPWSDEETNKSTVSNKNNTPASSVANQPKLPLTTTPYQLTPYQMAVQQQQRQAALALQQAMYQRQLLMAQAWAQHQQMMLHHQQQMRQQQMFVFGQQQGHK